MNSRSVFASVSESEVSSGYALEAAPWARLELDREDRLCSAGVGIKGYDLTISRSDGAIGTSYGGWGIRRTEQDHMRNHGRAEQVKGRYLERDVPEHVVHARVCDVYDSSRRSCRSGVDLAGTERRCPLSTSVKIRITIQTFQVDHTAASSASRCLVIFSISSVRLREANWIR
jgi:hypothetical protein